MRRGWLIGVMACGRFEFTPVLDAGAEVDAETDAPPSLGDLVLHYPMDELAGDVLVDVSGYGHDGVCAAGQCPVQDVGVRDGALRFDGIDDLLTAVSSPTLSSLTAYTVAVWLRRDALAVGCVFGKRVGPTIGNTFQICIGSAEDARFFNWNGTLNESFSVVLNVDTSWHHVAIRFSGGSESFYWDGAFQVTRLVDKMFDAGPLVLGADIDDSTPLAWFGGRLDDIRIYNRELSDAEIAELANAP